MTQEITVLRDQVLIALSGSMYLDMTKQIRENLLQFIDHGHNNLFIDLAGVDYIDSSGLGMFVAVHNQARNKKGYVVFTGVRGLVKDLIVLTRLDRVLEIQ